MRLLMIYSLIMLLTSCNPSELKNAKQNGNNKKVKEKTQKVSKAGPEDQEQLKTDCVGAQIKSMDMPIDHNNKAKGTFSYKFQHVVNSENAPTVIEIPGGPGQDGIATDLEIINKHLNYIFIDPRGLGCNFVAETTLTDDVTTTTQHATDIINIVKNLNLTNYVIHGISYGTVVVTEISHLLNDNDFQVTLPKAFVLEGIVGKVEMDSQYHHRFAYQWRRLQDKVPSLKSAFANNDALPFGHSLPEWNHLARLLITVGEPHSSRFLSVAANPSDFSEDAVKKTKDRLASILKNVEENFAAKGSSRIYDLIGCRELFNVNEKISYIVDGDMHVLNIEDLLEPGESLSDFSQSCYARDLTKPFDAVNYKMADVPTYYFHGSDDPNTAIEGGRYHYSAQNHLTTKYFIETLNAGHNPFSVQLDECKASLWDAIFAGKSPYDAGLIDESGKCSSTNFFFTGSQHSLEKEEDILSKMHYLIK